MRKNVVVCLPRLRKQIRQHGYPVIRRCLVNGQTTQMSPRDRRECLEILDAEYLKKPGFFRRLFTRSK